MILTWLHIGILLFLFFALLFAGGPIIGSLLLAPKYKGGEHAVPYECGMLPHGRAWGRFGINYFVYALIFIAFDVDVLYLFPVAAAYPDTVGWGALVKVFIFLFVMALGVLYFWKKGVFTWPRRITE